MSFGKNVVEYNLFAIKLSAEKILDQFFVWLPITEKIADKGKNLDFTYFLCQKLGTRSGVKETPPN